MHHVFAKSVAQAVHPLQRVAVTLVFALASLGAVAEDTDGFLIYDCACKAGDGSRSCEFAPGQTWITQIDPINSTYAMVTRRANRSLESIPGPPKAWQCKFARNRFDCSFSESNGDYYLVKLDAGRYVDQEMILKNGKRVVTVSQECKAKPAVVPK